jgi:hypothetical protein
LPDKIYLVKIDKCQLALYVPLFVRVL